MRSIMLQYANFRVGIDKIADEIKRLNDTKQFYYTAEYQAGTQLFLLRVLCAILF